MDEEQVVRILEAVEAELDGEAEPDLGPFWKAVASVKRHPGWIERFADRIGEIDQRAFRRWRPLLLVPAPGGTALAAIATAIGLGIIAAGYSLDDPWNGLAMLVGTGVLLGSTHGLAHLVVGTAQGMRFTHWFVADLVHPQPGVKLDYASYLRVAPRRRAWMHASGAIVTKLIPFLTAGASLAADAPTWTAWTLVGLGVLQVVTDAAWSVKASDWKRFRREMRYA